MASKTVSELSKLLSPNRAAFDLPYHEGAQVAPSQEPARSRERATKRVWSKPHADWPTKPGTTPQARRRVAGAPGQAMLMATARALDVTAHDAVLLSARGGGDAGEPVGGLIKRLLDIVVAGMALIVLSPLLLVVAATIYATSGRPILFPQIRLGFRGRPFACYKFRTMVPNAEATLQAHLDSNPEAAREWYARQKLEDDPRVTAIGRVLRRSSIDELPQLFSVLGGSMSCVGPRPIIAEEVHRYGRYWADYTSTRPGLTGAWQVSGRNRVSYRRRVALDIHYVRNWSIWRDLLILLKTIPAVLRTDDTA